MVAQASADTPVATSEQIWRWLADVADPEIPVLSIVDLGLVRGVACDGGEVVVTITPTYSGCPAMLVIESDILKALRAGGVASPRVVVSLSPAWTTDWLTPRGRAALQRYGIAPPQGRAAGACGLAALRTPAAVVACPRCGSRATVAVSEFGSTPCKALYRCQACGEPFDYFKPH